MVKERQLTISFLDVVVGSVPIDSQQIIIDTVVGQSVPPHMISSRPAATVALTEKVLAVALRKRNNRTSHLLTQLLLKLLFLQAFLA
jgi:hypothetical protein